MTAKNRVQLMARWVARTARSGTQDATSANVNRVLSRVLGRSAKS